LVPKADHPALWHFELFLFISNKMVDSTSKQNLCPFQFKSHHQSILEHNGAVLQLYRYIKEAYGSVRKEVLYSILIEFGMLMRLVRLTKMSLNEMHSNIRIRRGFI
jgi:hypothetical protein